MRFARRGCKFRWVIMYYFALGLVPSTRCGRGERTKQANKNQELEVPHMDQRQKDILAKGVACTNHRQWE